MTYAIDKLMEMADVENEKAKKRILGRREANLILNLMGEADDSVITIRVYSQDGFVPLTYPGMAIIRYFEASRKSNGWHVETGSESGRKEFGCGALILINGRQPSD